MERGNKIKIERFYFTNKTSGEVNVVQFVTNLRSCSSIIYVINQNLGILIGHVDNFNITSIEAKISCIRRNQVKELIRFATLEEWEDKSLPEENYKIDIPTTDSEYENGFYGDFSCQFNFDNLNNVEKNRLMREWEIITHVEEDQALPETKGSMVYEIATKNSSVGSW